MASSSNAPSALEKEQVVTFPFLLILVFCRIWKGIQVLGLNVNV